MRHPFDSKINIAPVPNGSELKINKFYQRKKHASKWFKYVFLTLSSLVLTVMIAVLGYIIALSWPAITKVNIFGTAFQPSNHIYGVLGLIIGTLTVTIIALLVAIPVALFTSVFIITYLPKFIINVYRLTIEIFAGLPSIIFGLIGVVFLSKFIPLSFSLAGLVLSIMIIPIISAYLVIALTNYQKIYDYNSLALGATKIETIFKLRIKCIKRGIWISVLAGLARAIGETMAVAMVIGGSGAFPEFGHFINGFLSRSGSSLTVAIVTNFLEAQGLFVNVIFYLSLIIFVLVAVINSIAFYFLRKNHSKR